jgi:hypothetical protein
MTEEDTKEEDKIEMTDKIEDPKDKIEIEVITDINKMTEEEATTTIADMRRGQDQLKTMKEDIAKIKMRELTMITNITEEKGKPEEQDMLHISTTRIISTETETRITEHKIEDKEIQEKTDTQATKID